MRRLGWKFKKTLAAAERDRPDVAEGRDVWHKQLAVEPVTAPLFVDESGANTKMTRLRGRVLGGERLLARIPHGHYQTSTLVSGLRLEGPCAPWLFGGPMNGAMFVAWIRQGLAPTLRSGDVVILDNLATHKIRRVREAIEAVGARLLYLPPYSPDFNPIEPMWSKVKQVLRSKAPRIEDELLGRLKPPSARFPRPIAKASFLALNTLHNKCKFSSPPSEQGGSNYSLQVHDGHQI